MKQSPYQYYTTRTNHPKFSSDSSLLCKTPAFSPHRTKPFCNRCYLCRLSDSIYLCFVCFICDCKCTLFFLCFMQLADYLTLKKIHCHENRTLLNAITKKRPHPYQWCSPMLRIDNHFSLNIIGMVNFTFTFFPPCFPGIHLGIVFTTRRASLSRRSLPEPLTTFTLPILPSLYTTY